MIPDLISKVIPLFRSACNVSILLLMTLVSSSTHNVDRVARIQNAVPDLNKLIEYDTVRKYLYIAPSNMKLWEESCGLDVEEQIAVKTLSTLSTDIPDESKVSDFLYFIKSETTQTYMRKNDFIATKIDIALRKAKDSKDLLSPTEIKNIISTTVNLMELLQTACAAYEEEVAFKIRDEIVREQNNENKHYTNIEDVLNAIPEITGRALVESKKSIAGKFTSAFQNLKKEFVSSTELKKIINDNIIEHFKTVYVHSSTNPADVNQQGNANPAANQVNQYADKLSNLADAWCLVCTYVLIWYYKIFYYFIGLVFSYAANEIYVKKNWMETDLKYIWVVEIFALLFELIFHVTDNSFFQLLWMQRFLTYMIYAILNAFKATAKMFK